MNEIIAAIVGGIIGIVAALVGSFYTTNRQRRFDAVAKLRSAFAPALATIRLGYRQDSYGTPTAKRFFKDNLPNHAAAIEEFRHFVCKGNLAAYEEAWKKYQNIVCVSENDIDENQWIANIDVSSQESIDFNVTLFDAIEKHIYAILEFTKA